MYKRILVPTDVSEASRNALVTALNLARQFNATVELFYVTYTPKDYLSYTATYGFTVSQEDLDKIGEEALNAALMGIDIGDVKLEKKHVSGHPAHEIIEEIRRDFDLVVMGTHGHGPISGSIIGSVTQRVLSHTDCPVLVVK